MKKSVLFLSFIAAVTTSGSALAANQATLKVTGKLIPASCDITIETADVSLGDINISTLNKDTATQLDTHQTGLNVTCQAPTLFAFKPTDTAAKAGEVTFNGNGGPQIFSLGATTKGAIIGGYTVQINNALSQMDGKVNVGSLVSEDDGTSWKTQTGGFLLGSGQQIYSMSLDSLAPAAATTSVIKLDLKPFINATSGLGSAENIDINGVATYDIVYI